MTPRRYDLFDNVTLNAGVIVTIADGKKVMIQENGKVKLIGIDTSRIKMMNAFAHPYTRQTSAFGRTTCGARFKCHVQALLVYGIKLLRRIVDWGIRWERILTRLSAL